MKNLKIYIAIFLMPCFIMSISAEPETKTEPITTLKQLESRYNQAGNDGNILRQYEIAKKIFFKRINEFNLRPVNLWNERIDSLEKLLPGEVPRDFNYRLNKIFLEHRHKRYDKVIRMLFVLEPEIKKYGTNFQLMLWNYFLARTFSRQKDMAAALSYLVEAEKLNYEIEDMYTKAELLNVRSFIEWESNQKLSLALKVEALNIFEELNEYRRLSRHYKDVISFAKDLEEDELVAETTKKLNIINKRLGIEGRSIEYDNNEIFNLIRSEKYTEAITHADELLILLDSFDTDKTHTFYLRGIAYRGLNQYDKAADNIEKAYNMSIENGNTGRCAFYSFALYQTYAWRSKFENALRWYETHTTHKDSIFDEKKATEIVVYKSKLDALKQQKRADNLEAEILISKQRRRTLWIAIISGAVIFLTLLYAQWQRSRKKFLQKEAELKESLKEKEMLEREVEFKKKEITTQIINMTRKNNLLKEVNEKVETIESQENRYEISRIKRLIDQSLENSDEWEVFNTTFRSIHSSFFKRLDQLSDNITSGEIRLVSLMKMNLTSKEIASILNISDDGVKKARYRLRKKLDLPSEINIQEYILSI